MCGSCYANVDGTSGSSGLAEAGTAVLQIGIEYGIGAIFGNQEKKANEALVRRIQALEKSQQEELKNKLSNVTTELEKTKILYEYLGQQESQKRLADINKKRIIPIIAVSIGALALVFIFIKLKK
jgi:hypothetical protein